MPRIPQLGTPRTPTTAVDLGAQPNRRGAMAMAGAVESLGRVVEGFGQELLEKRKQAEVNTFVTESNMDFQLQSTEWEKELNTKYANNPKGYAEEYKARVDSWKQDRVGNAPSERSRDAFSRSFANQEVNTFGKALNWEQAQTAKNYIKGIETTANTAQQTLINKPDTMTAANLFKSQLDMVQAQVGVSYDAAQAETIKNKIGADYADSLLQGMMTNKMYGQGLKFIQGEDKAGGEFLKYVDANKLGHYQARFKAAMEDQNNMSKSLFNKNFNDVTSALTTGMEGLGNRVSEIKAQSAMLPQEQRQFVLDDLKMAEQINDNLITLKKLPIDQAEALVNANVMSEQDTSFNFESKSRMQSLYQKQAAAILKQRKEDPIAYHTANDRDFREAATQALSFDDPQAMSNYVEMAKTKQLQDGLPFRRILTDGMTNTYKSMLTAKDPVIAGQSYDKLKAGFGNNIGMVVSEIAQKDPAFRPYAIAYSVQDPEIRAGLLTNVANRKDIEAGFKQTKYKDRDIKQVFSSGAFTEFSQAVSLTDPTGENAWIRNGVGEMIEIEAKRLVSVGETPRSARKQAEEKIIKKNWDIVSSRNSKVLVPKSRQAAETVENFIQSSSSPKAFMDSFDIQVPSDYGKYLPDGDETSVKNRYFQDLAKDAMWISNGSQDGVYLAKKGVNGLEKVSDSKGRLIQVKFDEMDSILLKAKNSVASK